MKAGRKVRIKIVSVLHENLSAIDPDTNPALSQRQICLWSEGFWDDVLKLSGIKSCIMKELSIVFFAFSRAVWWFERPELLQPEEKEEETQESIW